MTPPIVYDVNWVTFSPEVIKIMRESNIGVRPLFTAMTTDFTEDFERRFVYFGRLFVVTRNSYGGPHVELKEV